MTPIEPELPEGGLEREAEPHTIEGEQFTDEHRDQLWADQINWLAEHEALTGEKVDPETFGHHVDPASIITI